MRLGLTSGYATDDDQQCKPVEPRAGWVQTELVSRNAGAGAGPAMGGGDSSGRVWCSTCHIYRPPECSHCRTCDACIVGHDHHCWWLATCIGECNHRAFVLTLTWATIVSLIVLEQAREALTLLPDSSGCPTAWSADSDPNPESSLNLRAPYVTQLLEESKAKERAADTWL